MTTWRVLVKDNPNGSLQSDHYVVAASYPLYQVLRTTLCTMLLWCGTTNLWSHFVWDSSCSVLSTYDSSITYEKLSSLYGEIIKRKFILSIIDDFEQFRRYEDIPLFAAEYNEVLCTQQRQIQGSDAGDRELHFLFSNSAF